MFGSVKMTLIICLTIVISVVLFISYNEYLNRYYLIATNNDSIFIFDKKSTFLNKCDSKGCSVIETRLPKTSSIDFETGFRQGQGISDSQRTMAQEVINPTQSASPAVANKAPESTSNKSQSALPPSSSPNDSAPSSEKATTASDNQSSASSGESSSSNSAPDSTTSSGTDDKKTVDSSSPDSNSSNPGSNSSNPDSSESDNSTEPSTSSNNANTSQSVEQNDDEFVD